MARADRSSPTPETATSNPSSIDPRAGYIWTSADGTERNGYALFRFSFTLAATPAQAPLHLFADTRYRLSVNGATVGHGPARFKVGFPEYDTHDVAPQLRPGRNVIAITVNSYGIKSFLSDSSRGGLIVWGAIADGGGGSISLASGPTWKAWLCPAWSADLPNLTFAVGPGECLDARLLPAAWDAAEFDDSNWPSAIPVGAPAPWGSLRPRSIPPLDERPVPSPSLLGVFAGSAAVAGICHRLAEVVPDTLNGIAAAVARLHSPTAQEITVAASAPTALLNGTPCPGTNPRQIPWHHEFRLQLRAGPNTLVLIDRPHGAIFNLLLTLPAAANLTLEPLRAGRPFLLGGPWDRPWDGLAAEFTGTDPLAPPAGSGATAVAAAWRPCPSTPAHTPFFDRCRLTLEPLASPAPGSPITADQTADATVFVFDFGGEVLGRPVIDLTAPAGTTVDLCYTERLVDGGADVTYQGTRMLERYVARDGRQTWQTMHPRGMRYLEITVGGPPAEFILHGVGLRRAGYPVAEIGEFACSDSTLNAIWQLCRATERVCMEDAFLDCPWRERGLYTGDLLVQFEVNLAAFGDHALMRRCLDLFFQTQDPDSGLLAPCSHGLPNNRHPDYSAVAIQVLHLYWARTGDLEFVRAHAGRLVRLADGLCRTEQPGANLADATGLSPYIDLGNFDRDGISCALNCFHYQALAATADLLDRLGDPVATAAAPAYRQHAAAVKDAVRAEFFDPATGLFRDRRLADVPGTGPSVQGNTLAVLYGLATAAETPAILAFLRDRLRNNFSVDPPAKNTDCNVTAYFSYYTLAVFYRHGLAADAEEFIRRQWGRLLDLGAWTCWEYFVPICSLCHAWAAHPAHYLSSKILGVEYAEPGNPNRIRIAPHPGTLAWAKGVYPHPAGPIRVAWKKDAAGAITVDCDAPAGVEVVA